MVEKYSFSSDTDIHERQENDWDNQRYHVGKVLSPEAATTGVL